MSRIIIGSSRWKNLLYCLVAAAMLVVGIITLQSGDEPVYGWLLTILGGLGAPVFGIIAFDRSPDFILDEDGVDLVGLGLGRLAWSDISMVYTDDNMRNYTYVVIELVDPQGLAERNAVAAAGIIDGKITFNGDGYTMSGDDIADAMMRFRSGLAPTAEQLRASDSIEDAEERA